MNIIIISCFVLAVFSVQVSGNRSRRGDELDTEGWKKNAKNFGAQATATVKKSKGKPECVEKTTKDIDANVQSILKKFNECETRFAFSAEKMENCYIADEKVFHKKVEDLKKTCS